MGDVLEVREFLDDATRAEILAAVRSAGGGAATVSGSGADPGVAPMVRKTTRVAVAPEVRARVKELFLARLPELREHFGVEIGDCEDPQFLRYEAGDFFVAHQDGNTSLIRDDTRFRRVSAVVFLTPRSEAEAEGTYGGGSLVFHGPIAQGSPRTDAPAAPGTMVAFRSETTHEVTPVTHGVRHTIVTWYR